MSRTKTPPNNLTQSPTEAPRPTIHTAQVIHAIHVRSAPILLQAQPPLATLLILPNRLLPPLRLLRLPPLALPPLLPRPLLPLPRQAIELPLLLAPLRRPHPQRPRDQPPGHSRRLLGPPRRARRPAVIPAATPRAPPAVARAATVRRGGGGEVERGPDGRGRRGRWRVRHLVA